MKVTNQKLLVIVFLCLMFVSTSLFVGSVNSINAQSNTTVSEHVVKIIVTTGINE